MKSASEKLFLDLHTMSAPSGEERTLGAAAQVERARWCCRRFDSDTHSGTVGQCHSHGLGLISLWAARERLPPRIAAFPTPPQNDNSECVFRNQKRASESRHTHREKARWDWLKPVPTP